MTNQAAIDRRDRCMNAARLFRAGFGGSIGAGMRAELVASYVKSARAANWQAIRPAAPVTAREPMPNEFYLSDAERRHEPPAKDWRDIAADEAGVPRFGEI